METLKVERHDGVVTVTMSRREKKNAANETMWRELAETFTAVERNDQDRVLVLTGAGGDFCSGADLAGMREDALRYMADAGEAARTLHALTIPTIAKVDGVAVGAGWNLALGCDLVVATDRARFSQIFVRRALSVDMGGSWLLPKLVGIQKAKEIAFFGDMYSAAEAAELGLVTRLVTADELDDTVDAMARRLVDGPAQALSLAKQLLDASAEGGGMEAALRREAHAQANNINGDDAKEAKAAFLEKRAPVFRPGAAAAV
ncbi:enoyl-CoA hydratase-related protein [Rhodococcus sp. HM1]|uniref:enoyl-CoA hydratase/isomerase family protein n=1 Tax=Rhodococcus sp. HM1 TaxID=2937759 RepID=UPI00200B8159|nr:enoyl-CoA hydratase-related protein [Rhodococcus sp. HM1]MCK8672098.1 enoyl-CoA hydratase-related protein [Rhodococcus sp. HM1]